MLQYPLSGRNRHRNYNKKEKGREEGMRKKPILERVERTQVVYRGLTEAARWLGCSRAHLSYVLHGQRKASEGLRRGLAQLGIEIQGEEA